MIPPSQEPGLFLVEWGLRLCSCSEHLHAAHLFLIISTLQCELLKPLSNSICTDKMVFNRKENFNLFLAECPDLKQPTNGKSSYRKVSGQMLCIFSCDEGFSFSKEAISQYTCGPESDWKWNSMDEVEVPTCLRA